MPDDMILDLGTLASQQTVSCSISLNTSGQLAVRNPLMKLDVAIKNNDGVSYFTCQPPLRMFYVED